MGAGTAWRRFVFFAVLCGWWTDRHSMSKKKIILTSLDFEFYELGNSVHCCSQTILDTLS